MAYRRRQGITRVSTFKEDLIYNNNDNNENGSSDHSPYSAPASASASPSLAAQAIRASAAARRNDSTFFKPSSHHQDTATSYNYTTDEAGGFWSVVARKAKSILDDDDDDDNMSQEFGTPNRENAHMHYNSSYSTAGQFYHPYHYAPEMSRKVENPTLHKGLDALTSSLNQIGDSIGNALEEGRSLVENKTADIIQETRKLKIRRKGTNSTEQIHLSGVRNPWQEPVMSSVQPQMQSNQETQLKASRDVAMATAAKAKLLLRELKTTKADLAFAKQRCSQLEEENKILREAYENGDHPADEDMIRLQLETLLEEKARLAHENSIYGRENRFLREIIEYHQLTMQDVVYLDEGIEEVTEVYPVPALSRMRSGTPTSPRSPRTPSRISTVSRDSCTSIPLQAIPNVIQDETSPTTSVQLQAITDLPKSGAPPSSSAPVSTPKGSIRRSNRYA